MVPKKCDVVVIGGGPAGSMAAGLLAKQGIDVVLLEKARFPRNAVGESLIPNFWKFTDLIGASDAIEQEGFLAKKGGIVHWEGKTRKVSFASFGFERPALHVERDIFDQILLKRAQEIGTQVFEQVKVTNVQSEEGKDVQVNYKYEISGEPGLITAKYLVDASGQQAVLANQKKIRDFDRDFAFQAVWAYFDSSDYFDQNTNKRRFNDRREHSPLTTVASIGNWGWSWHIVLREKVSVGLVLPKNQMATFKKGGADLESRFETYSRQVPLIGSLLVDSQLISKSVQSVRDYAYRSQQLVVDNCFMVGDAAAFVDPISSEGVPMAMYGGYLAAWAIANSLKRKKRANFYGDLFLQEYEKRLLVFKMLAFPSKQLPLGLVEGGKKAIKGFSEKEIRLIMAQARLTGRKENFIDLFRAFDSIQDTLEVEKI